MNLLCGELRLTFDEPVPADSLIEQFRFPIFAAAVAAQVVGGHVDHNDPYSVVLPFRVCDD